MILAVTGSEQPADLARRHFGSKRMQHRQVVFDGVRDFDDRLVECVFHASLVARTAGDPAQLASPTHSTHSLRNVSQYGVIGPQSPLPAQVGTQ